MSHVEHNETLACAHEMAPGLAIRWPPPTMLATECPAHAVVLDCSEHFSVRRPSATAFSSSNKFSRSHHAM